MSIAESDWIYVKSDVICNKNTHVDDTVTMCWCCFFCSVFMLHMLLQVGLHRSVGQYGDWSILRHSALWILWTITSEKQ